MSLTKVRLFFGLLSLDGLCVQRGMEELIDSGRYDTHANFTVVLQPFLRKVFLPKLEVTNTPQTLDYSQLSLHSWIYFGIFIVLILLCL